MARCSWFVARKKKRHYTRLGCGEISLAGFPRGNPYETAAGRVFFYGLPSANATCVPFHRLYAIP